MFLSFKYEKLYYFEWLLNWKSLFVYRQHASDTEDTANKEVLKVAVSLLRSTKAPTAILTGSHERCADSPELRCCWESATTCQGHSLLSVVPLSYGHEWHCKLKPGQSQGKLQSPGSASMKYCAQVIFSFILLVRKKSAARNRCIMQISYWLCGWCLQEVFGFYENGEFFSDYTLLKRDGIHLSRRDKGIFAADWPTWWGGL